MASLNKVILIGHLGADPDIRYLPDGTPVASLRLATTETWKDKCDRREAGANRVAPSGSVPRTGRHRRPVSEKRLAGVRRGPAADPQMDLLIRRGPLHHRDCRR